MRFGKGWAGMAVAAAVAGSLHAGPATAAVYTFSYTGAGLSASGTFTTQDVLTTGTEGRMGYLLTSISGTRNGVAITGLRDAATFGFPIDNRLYLTAPLVNFDGLGYGTNAASYNLYFSNTFIEYSTTGTDAGVTSFSVSRAAAPGAPAPEVGAGLLSGLAAGVALFLTRRRRVDGARPESRWLRRPSPAFG